MSWTIKAQHGKETHAITVPTNGTMIELFEAIEISTGVPRSNQKVIHKGKSYNSNDNAAKISSTSLKNGEKVKVLGKKSDPQTDELLAALSKENATTDTIEDELDDLEESFATTTQGHLPDDLVPEAVEKFGKQLLKANLALEKGLVRLDSLNVTPGRQRDLRKNSVKKVQKILAQADRIEAKLNAFRTGGADALDVVAP